MQSFHSTGKLTVSKLFFHSNNHLCEIFVLSINNRQKLGIEGKTYWCLEVRKMIAENDLLTRREAPVSRWTSVRVMGYGLWVRVIGSSFLSLNDDVFRPIFFICESLKIMKFMPSLSEIADLSCITCGLVFSWTHSLYYGKNNIIISQQVDEGLGNLRQN